ncbi:MAG: tyrosine-type recombinase/integrase [Chloroflexia bacterium]
MSNEHTTRKLGPNRAQPLDLESVAFYLDGFLLDQRAQRHSPATITFYRRYIKNFIWFLAQGADPTALAQITPNHIRAYLVYLQEHSGGRWGKQETITCKPLKPAAVHAHARALRAFWNWASTEADLPANPFTKIEMPKLPDAWTVQTYSDEQIAALFAACDEAMTPVLIARDRAILAVLFDSGLRASELLRLTVGDADTPDGVFTVTGKGAKKRAVVIGTFARRELRRYLQARGKQAARGAALFLGRDGAPLTYYGLKELFNRLKNRAGISIQGGAHLCRHTFATKAHRNGMRGSTLQELLGHTKFDTTRRYYLDISKEDLAAEHEQCGPLDNMAGQLKHKRPQK